MSNVVQFSKFGGNKKTNTAPANTPPSPKALREQAALKQDNQCYFCGARKEPKELHWLDKVGFKNKAHVVCGTCSSDAKSRSMDELRIILALKAMDFRTVKLKQYIELREKGVHIDGVREYKFYFETIE
ncbi:hypothetical protein BCT30_12465 [Enterovibrio norvegicus]|uniref:hypothetical protein n=1 Tax=Enterovibrio norvegicus TaxID=188144 RepID=UPI0002FFEE1E|nr:hypothetical protein [Enterovibrio norvegicus]MCC4796465.1 hypothetical protein [Enterovibrio norvegicus]OEE60903.1 hypothetical protein A1OS_19835 [Enterovibrio norvegicus]PMI26743.1 hypothetical protein BCU47_22845 [Enterovibrio norvegicus]PMI37392.1 hypothetical protein BCU46_11575 [Enterovibrio norvegicus]PMN52962.1 hypothetical protein BCT30_12465 [Enterovibrio norvegicus]